MRMSHFQTTCSNKTMSGSTVSWDVVLNVGYLQVVLMNLPLHVWGCRKVQRAVLGSNERSELQPWKVTSQVTALCTCWVPWCSQEGFSGITFKNKYQRIEMFVLTLTLIVQKTKQQAEWMKSLLTVKCFQTNKNKTCHDKTLRLVWSAAPHVLTNIQKKKSAMTVALKTQLSHYLTCNGTLHITTRK